MCRRDGLSRIRLLPEALVPEGDDRKRAAGEVDGGTGLAVPVRRTIGAGP